MDAMRRWLTRGLIVVGLALVLAQLVPYGRHHTHPRVVAEPDWSSPDVRVLAARVCFDCHSNETHWPWYASIAPASWVVQHDVEEGRRVLNFSEWDHPQEEAADSAQTVRERAMPPLFYSLAHSDARLTLDERERLIKGLAETFGTQGQPAAQADPPAQLRPVEY
jgi:hypothetical protein